MCTEFKEYAIEISRGTTTAEISSDVSNIKIDTDWGQLLSVKIWTVNNDGVRSPTVAIISTTTISTG